MHAGELIAAVPKGCPKTLQSKGKDTIMVLSMFQLCQ